MDECMYNASSSRLESNGSFLKIIQPSHDDKEQAAWRARKIKGEVVKLQLCSSLASGRVVVVIVVGVGVALRLRLLEKVLLHSASDHFDNIWILDRWRHADSRIILTFSCLLHKFSQYPSKCLAAPCLWDHPLALNDPSERGYSPYLVSH